MKPCFYLVVALSVAAGLTGVTKVTGHSVDLRNATNLEPPRGGKPYPQMMVPPGCDTNIAFGCKVTSSDPNPTRGKLSYITEGDKEPDENTHLELASGTQWVQIELGKECEIWGIYIWHLHGSFTRVVFFDVICQISDDPDFIDGVVTVFNNDHDNSSGQGIGKDKEYIETNEGRPILVNGVKGRYVRFYSRGYTGLFYGGDSSKNYYMEIEIYGRGAQDGASETQERIPVRVMLPKPGFM
jgi:hypothetical protein